MTQHDSLVRPAAGSHLEMASVLANDLATISRPRSLKATSSLERPRGNIISGESHHAALATALTTIADAVGRTLGPHGSNALVRDEHGAHFATKDGYTVLQRMTFVQETATMVLDHVRSVSRTMVRRVGDGSTSAVIMADSLYSSFRQSDDLAKYPPGAIQGTLNTIADVLIERIRAAARPVCNDDLGTVAAIAANNDPWAGAKVAEAYRIGGDDANVFVRPGGEETEIRKEPGYRVMRGMAHDCFANEAAGADGAVKTVCRFENPAVMVFGDRVGQAEFNQHIAPFMNDCISAGTPFVLVAREFSDDVMQVVVEFKRRSPGVQLLLLDHVMATRRGLSRLGDLAAVLGCDVIDATRKFERSIGSAAAVRSTASETVFALATVTDGARSRVEELRLQIERVDISNNAEELSEEIEELRARIRAMLGSEVTLFVGGATDQEKKALAYLMDDSVLAVAAARRSGVVEGLGMTVQRALYKDVKILRADVITRAMYRTSLRYEAATELVDQLLEAVARAYRSATARVLENARMSESQIEEVFQTCMTGNAAYNVMTQQYDALPTASVLNPADTDIEVLRGAMSIVALFISSDQTILIRPTAGGGLD